MPSNYIKISNRQPPPRIRFPINTQHQLHLHRPALPFHFLLFVQVSTPLDAEMGLRNERSGLGCVRCEHRIWETVLRDAFVHVGADQVEGESSAADLVGTFRDCTAGVLLGTMIWAAQWTWGPLLDQWFSTPGWQGSSLFLIPHPILLF